MSIESRIDGIEARIHADGVSVPPSSLPPFTRPTLRPTNRDRQGLALVLPRQQMVPRNETENKLRDIMAASGIIKLNGLEYRTDMKDLLELEELGDGTSGHVVKMRHIPSGEVIAVKQMRRTGNAEENKRIVNDIETAIKAHGCPHIVQCLGFIITSADVWICMELMSTCFDKLLKRTARPVPEDILGKVTFSVVNALSFLKDKGTMHRDVKPSNILVDERGVIKLCDFGISGQLNNSKAKTRSAGCVAYLAPERIDPNNSEYDIRADVWSLGITLVELATGKFPYRDCSTDFEVLTCVMQSAPPTLPADQGFSLEFQNFVKRCLIHDVNSRPKYKDLLQLPFLMYYEARPVNVADWLKNTMRLAGLPAHQRDLISQNQVGDKGRFAYQQIDLCDSVTSTQPSFYASSSSTANIPVPFVKVPPSSIPDNQYCNLRVGSFDGSPGLLLRPIRTITSSNSAQTASAVPLEAPKIYRKSPFLPRKKDSPENKLTLKKESKLTTLGSSLLKNLTTSPFSQRKQSVPQPNDLPPSPLVERRAPKFSSHQPPLASTESCQTPRHHHFHNPPLLQRRNPSYISYPENHNHMSPNRGRTSADTSPIVLQRFYHQQSQLRGKVGDEWQVAPPDYSQDDRMEDSNPFASGDYHQPLKYQTPKDGGHLNVISGATAICGEPFIMKEPSSKASAASSIPTPVFSCSQQTSFEVNQTPHFGAKISSIGKLHDDKNMGDVKRRFASYLKVTMNADRRQAEECSYQSHTENRNGENGFNKQVVSAQPFAPTNPFLDAEDSLLASSDALHIHATEKLKIERRHRSPDPPPRYNRGQSPLVLRKKLEMSNWGGSPLLPRRFISGSPPVQPRRDCESVPGSPQHFRTRIHYTPEPQRRFYRP